MVATRAILSYHHSKPRALAELFSVLRPGGRISLYEPLNRLTFPEPADEFFLGYRVGPVGGLADTVKATEDCSNGADRVLMDCDERRLWAFASGAQFREVHLDLHRPTSCRLDQMGWEVFSPVPPTPWRRPTAK